MISASEIFSKTILILRFGETHSSFMLFALFSFGNSSQKANSIVHYSETFPIGWNTKQ